MKKTIISLFLIFSLVLFLAACGGSGDNGNTNSPADTASTEAAPDTASTSESTNPPYDPNRGEGKFHDVQVSDKLNKKEADEGQKTYELKCSSCHKLSSERLVGPGWKGVTQRHSPTWIMNFVTNTDQMIDKDPKAQAMLEICMVRMPNQNLTDDQARDVLEFMRKNDGVK